MFKLSSVSKELLSNYEKYNMLSSKDIKINNDPNVDTMELYKTFFDLFKNSELNIRNINIKHNLFQEITNYDMIPKPKNFNHIPLIIRTYIKKNSKYCIKYNYNILNHKINIFFITKEFIIKEYDEIVYLMLFYLYTILSYIDTKYAKTLNIYLYLTSLKKFIKSKKNITFSGFTKSCKIISNITIFRKEEIIKVFIHELFHVFNLDASCKIFPRKKSCFGLSSIKIFEAYSETWSKIINSMLCSYFLIPIRNFKNFCNTTDLFIKNEIIHNIFQAKKFLALHNIEYKAIESIKDEYNNNSYYIVSLIMLIDYNNFVSWCKKYNKNFLEIHRDELKPLCDHLHKLNFESFIYHLEYELEYNLNYNLDYTLKNKLEIENITDEYYFILNLRKSLYEISKL